MAGSIYGNIFKISTWGESHGRALGVTIDGCPAGVEIDEEYIQSFLNRRKPGQNKYTTPRSEADKVEILSGIFEGKTTGTPISLLVYNQDQHSKDYGNLANCYRPGHADYCFDKKYGIRDYRGGGRSSGRETIGRVAAGAIAIKILNSLGIELLSYTKSIGPHEIDYNNFDKNEITNNSVSMPDSKCATEAKKYLDQLIEDHDSTGSCVECIISNMPVGIGEPVFNKLDALLAHGIMSIGAVKAVEIGDGVKASKTVGSYNNDEFCIADGKVQKKTNHSGGILGGMSDGSPIVITAHFKPTPSIFKPQETIDKYDNEVTLSIKGRHDPIIGPRAVVVVESMCAVTILDLLLMNATSRIDSLKKIYS